MNVKALTRDQSHGDARCVPNDLVLAQHALEEARVLDLGYACVHLLNKALVR